MIYLSFAIYSAVNVALAQGGSRGLYKIGFYGLIFLI